MGGQERKKGHPSTAELGEVGKKVCKTGRETKCGEGGRAPFLERRAGPTGVRAGSPTGFTAGASGRDESDSPGDKGQGAGGVPSSGGAGRPRHLTRSGRPSSAAKRFSCRGTRAAALLRSSEPRAATSLGRNARPPLRGAGKGEGVPPCAPPGGSSSSRVSRGGGGADGFVGYPPSFRRVARPQDSVASALLGAAHPPGCSMTHGRSCCSRELLPKAPGAKRPADAAGGRANLRPPSIGSRRGGRRLDAPARPWQGQPSAGPLKPRRRPALPALVGWGLGDLSLRGESFTGLF